MLLFFCEVTGLSRASLDFYTPSIMILPSAIPESPTLLPGHNAMSTLNVASRIYVINLPRSTQRRLDMEQVRYTLGLEFTYVNATESDGDAVRNILRQVANFRALANTEEIGHPLPPAFEWPQDVDELIESVSPLGMKGSDLWHSDGRDLAEPPSHEPLVCADENSIPESYSPQTPPWQVLTRERVACWHSHWRVIRTVADGQDEVALILEDDVDMELDIRQRLLGVWNSLPSEWDIVFLGIAYMFHTPATRH